LACFSFTNKEILIR